MVSLSLFPSLSHFLSPSPSLFFSYLSFSLSFSPLPLISLLFTPLLPFPSFLLLSPSPFYTFAVPILVWGNSAHPPASLLRPRPTPCPLTNYKVWKTLNITGLMQWRAHNMTGLIEWCMPGERAGRRQKKSTLSDTCFVQLTPLFLTKIVLDLQILRASRTFDHGTSQIYLVLGIWLYKIEIYRALRVQ